MIIIVGLNVLKFRVSASFTVECVVLGLRFLRRTLGGGRNDTVRRRVTLCNTTSVAGRAKNSTRKGACGPLIGCRAVAARAAPVHSASQPAAGAASRQLPPLFSKGNAGDVIDHVPKKNRNSAWSDMIVGARDDFISHVAAVNDAVAVAICFEDYTGALRLQARCLHSG